MFKLKRSFTLWLVGILSTTTLLLGSAAAYASISYAYEATSHLTNGDIVSLVNKKSEFVEPTNTSNSSSLLGIVSLASSSTLEVNPSLSSVQVVISGSVPVLVSTINGPITAGEQISISPLSGLGMKAEPNLPLVGTAQTSFNSSSHNASQRRITDTKGHTKTIVVGYILLSMKIGGVNASTSSVQPKLNGLQQTVRNLTGRTVSTIRIIISLVVSIVAIIILGMLVYSSVFGSIISIGRNPLARASIRRTLSGVLGMAAILAIVTVIIDDILLS